MTARFNLCRLAAVLAIGLGLTGLATDVQARFQDPAPTLARAVITGPIGPAASAYVNRAVSESADMGASALVIALDTPGGLESSTRDIVQSLLAAPVPVIVYVSPSGGRAASAGAFITYASHLAAMAPGSSIGAATPIQMGGGTPQPSTPSPEPDGDRSGSDPDATMSAPAANAPGDAQALRNKVVNDAAAWIRSLAALRGRNAEWAEAAVRDGVSASAEEALALGVVEIVAADLDDLIAQAHGRDVVLASGPVTLDLADAAVTEIDKTFAEEALAVITDPNIAFLLLNLGFVGLLVSFYNGLEPITAIAGLICLIVGLYALNTLPLNYAGAALVALGIILLVAEAFLASSGLLALGGLCAFAIGALMLIDTDSEAFRIDWRTIAAVTAGLGLVTFALLSYGLAAQARKVTTGDKGLIGQTGAVLEWEGGKGYVLVDGERWSAVSRDALAPGDAVRVKKVEGLTLEVRKI